MKQALLIAGIALVAAGLIILLLPPDQPYYQIGVASWYGPNFHGQSTASGETFNMNETTAAHKTLPFGTLVEVVDLETGRKVTVKINDRGPFIRGRIIDLSRKAAQKLGIIDRGTAKVGLRIVQYGNN